MNDHRIRLGATVISSDLLAVLTPDDFVSLDGLLARHQRGDCGDLDVEDRAANEDAVACGERVLSAYRMPSGTRVWIITEADRSVTTILRPEDY